MNFTVFSTIFYSTLSFFLYFLTIFIILRNWRKDFASSFFKLYIFGFFINFLTFFCSIFVNRLAAATCQNCLFSWFFEEDSKMPRGNVFLAILIALLLNGMFLQNCLVIVISMNRFTLIFLVRKAEEHWNRSLPFLFPALFLLPFYFTYPILTKNAYFVYSNSSDSYSALSEYSNTKNIWIYLEYFMGFSTVISAILNFSCFFRLFLMGQRVESGEKNMLVFSFVSLLSQTFALVSLILMSFYIYSPTERYSPIALLIYRSVDISYDIITMNSPWTLLILSSKLRKHILTIFWKKEQKLNLEPTSMIFQTRAQSSRF